MNYYISILIMICCINAEVSFTQDWAELNKYKESNQKLKVEERSPKAVFMGNSITEGWVNMRPDFFINNSFVGRGIGGQTTPQMLVRFRQDVIDLNPEVVLILAGTNDIAGNTGPMSLEMILGNIKSMAELAESNGVEVVLCSVLPAFDYPWRPGLNPNVKIPALNAMIKAYSQDKGFIYLDYFSAMADERNGLPGKYAEDEVHPTLEGYKVMEPLALQAIRNATNNKMRE